MYKYKIEIGKTIMAADSFNSLGGFSVGIPSIPVIDSNGNVVTNVFTPGNVAANVMYSGSYRYSNGVSIISGSDTQVQFNNNGVLGSNPSFVFDSANSQLVVQNLSVTGITTLVGAENLKIPGGNNGYFLQTDGEGNLSWAAGGGGGGNGSPGGSNAQIQFNDEGTFGADSGFTYNKNTNVLTVQTANATAVNASSAILSFANITTANATTINVSGNINVANRVNANVISSTTGNVQFIGNVNVGSQGNLNISNISSLHIAGGNNGYFLQTDGFGNLIWSAAGGGNGSPGGFTNQVQYNKAGLFSGSPYFTYDDYTNTLQIAGKFIANSVQLGAGAYKYSETVSLVSGTASTAPNQIIYSIPASGLSGVDFDITATNAASNVKNSFVIASLLNGSSVDFTEYGGIYINGSVGDFNVVYNPGDIITPPAIELTVSPTNASQTVYKMLITTFSN